MEGHGREVDFLWGFLRLWFVVSESGIWLQSDPREIVREN